MQKWWFLVVFGLILVAFKQLQTLKGSWQYCGGKFNNKLSPASKDYQQIRKYTDTGFNAFLYEKGEKPLKYESGTYTLNGDTCLETQTYSLQPSKLMGITVHYLYKIQHDTLVISAKLPNGAMSEDYWKRVK